LQILLNNDNTLNTSVGSVTFEPGTRTNWHRHPGGEILLVISGKGLYQEKGSEIRELRQGDVIKCLPNIVHWHGATPEEGLTHVAIGTNTNKGSVEWHEKVTDEEYKLRR
jgi:4-carboxymuconolactone decarboxylase